MNPELLLQIQRNGAVPLRIQIERGLRNAIQGGRLPAGAPLPATRALAGTLGVSRGLVVLAYEQLVAEGYLNARRGSATRVSGEPAAPPKRLSPAKPRVDPDHVRPRYDFRPGIPDLDLFPRNSWLRSLRRALGSVTSEAFDYPDPRGAEPARVAMAEYLNRSRATAAHESRVVFCTGNAQALRLMGQILRDRGQRRVAIEEPGHNEQCGDLQASGLTTVPVPVDERGIRVDMLRKADVGAVLVTPAHQYPTGAVLDPERRAELITWATARDAIIMEDDYDAEYRYDREPVGAMQGLAPERIVYMGTASKMLAPALRLAWMVLPLGLVSAVSNAKVGSDRGSPALDQLALADFLERGELDRHLRRTRAIYRRRRDTLVAALKRHLPHLSIHGIAAGLHLMLELPAGTDEEAVHLAARRASIRVRRARPHYARRGSYPPAILIGYGAIPETDIPSAVALLAGIIRKGGNP